MISETGLKKKRASSYLYAGNASFIETLYEQYLSDPEAVDPSWRRYFKQVESMERGRSRDIAHTPIQQVFAEMARKAPARRTASVTQPAMRPDLAEKQAAVLRLIQAYRRIGHLRAHVDPIRLRDMPAVPELDLYFHGLSDADRDTVFSAGDTEGPPMRTLAEIVQALKETYTGHIGVEYLHITDIQQKRWIERRLERSRSRPSYDSEKKIRLLRGLTAAEGLERHLHVTYTGQKRFSLEGAEGFIPFLDTLIGQAGKRSLREIALGMAHRGRLNVLINIMGKMPRELFTKFEGGGEQVGVDVTAGDVKYHEGYSAGLQVGSDEMHVALAFNPSHLEIVDPVVSGSVRARQDRRGDTGKEEAVAVLIHGDAAITGQGVVYETFTLVHTRGYNIGGTIHIVLNNRIGFTLSNPRDYRSTQYCTDIGKVVQAPIFHVNGDDPEALAFVAELAVDFRTTFNRDVLIDLICFRRHGHNEADEPSATQPMMYRKIHEHPGARSLYARRLIEEGVLASEDEAEAMASEYRNDLESNRWVALYSGARRRDPYLSDWSPFLDRKWTDPADTAILMKDIRRLGVPLTKWPKDFEPHPRVARVMEDRRAMYNGKQPMDWGAAEVLAYATLLDAGHPVRLAGQDTARGTFFHRHAVLHNQRDGETYAPLDHIRENQAPFTVIDTIVSEEAVLGFEYGYATSSPNTLTIWEAQYGDFVNGAQVVIDQFLSSSEQKWGLLCGLVLMLPHGWEGQGPEHTSARLERFLQLCVNENMQVCQPTTPAQMFHLLRRELVRAYRKPLIIMSPKSMLRRKASFSAREELTQGGFRVVIGETGGVSPKQAKRVVLCSGKVYYDMLEVRQERGMDDVALVRIEQLYPFPDERLKAEMSRYPRATEVVWAQEEPMNQGAWYTVQHPVRECMNPGQSLYYAGRLPSVAPSGGHFRLHVERQQRLIRAALNPLERAPHPIPIMGPKDDEAHETGRKK